MKTKRIKQFFAVSLLALATHEVLAQKLNEFTLGDELLVEARSDKSISVITPTQTIELDALQNKGASSLGESLSNQVGISSSGFGAASTRPVVRGLEGNRVEVLQNGMNGGDVSALSNDHAVASDAFAASKIEILRGPAALKYGSSSSGGLINIQNDRIGTEPAATSGILEGTLGSVDQSKRIIGSAEGGINQLAIRADFGQQQIGNYLQPNGVRLPYSFVDQKDAGLGLSYIRDDGYTGISFMQRQNFYGIPSSDGGIIDQKQNRFDVAHLTRNPWVGIKAFEFKAAYTDYQHSELDHSGAPQARFLNQQYETRFDFLHEPLFGWDGAFGVKYATASIAANEVGLGANTIVPKTDSNSIALYLLESKSVGSLTFKLGGRYEVQTLAPVLQASYATGSFIGATPMLPTVDNKTYSLFSYSGSVDWNYAKGYVLGLTYSQFARAPGIGELYAYGPHESTATFDVGSTNLTTELSRNWELAWKKNSGKVQVQIGAYQNTISNYIYGQYTGSVDAVSGFQVRQFNQASAIIRGVEADLTYNPQGSGLSGRLFGDLSKGSFVDLGNLPLQPAPRVGFSANYRHGPWEEGLSWIYAASQTNLATFETLNTPAYNRIDANLAYKAQIGSAKASFFLQIRNLLNDEIRYSTTVEALRGFAPQAGRGIYTGVKLIY